MRRSAGGARVSDCFIVGILLAVSGCSNFSPFADAPKQPSLNVADAALSAGAPDLALRVADLALAKQPNDVRALTAKGDALYAMGEREAAQRVYRAAVAIDPSAVAAHVGLGRTLARSDPQTAEAAFLTALQRDPENVVALNDLGVIWDVQGRHEEAQKAYRHALAVSPESVDVQVNLGRSLALSGHSGEARELLRAIAADSGASQAWGAELAAALSIAGDAPSAQRLAGAGTSRAEQPPLQARSEVVHSASAERLADASGAEPPGTSAKNPATAGSPHDQGGDAGTAVIAPAPAVAPRIAVTQSDLPPSLPPANAVLNSGKAPTVAGAIKASHGSNVSMEAMATASGVAASLSTLSATEPGPVAQPKGQTPAATAEPRSTGVDGPYVQLASLLSEPDALFEWRRLDKRFPDLLAGHEPTVTAADAKGRVYWRLRTFGFASMEDAKELCGQFLNLGWRCISGRGL